MVIVSNLVSIRHNHLSLASQLLIDLPTGGESVGSFDF